MRYPASPPPLSNQDTYTTWPGGVDPTARVYSSVGGKRARLAAKSPKRSALKRRQTPKRRRSTRKARRNHRKVTRRY
jgi:hypothetical protein